MLQWVASSVAVLGSFGTLYFSKRVENLRFKALLLSNSNETQFDDETIAVLRAATWKAYGRGDDAVECEHVLAAAISTDSLMQYRGVQKHPDVIRIVKSHFGARAMPNSGLALPYSRRAAIALSEATRAATERSSPIVTSDDLMVGIARTGRGRAARALKAAGVSVESLPAMNSPELPGPER